MKQKYKLENLIRTMRRTQMSERERKSIRNNVVRFAEINPARNPSPYFKISPYFSYFNFNFSFMTRASVTLLLFVVLGTGGLTMASAKALPGDLLYPIKINLKEKIEENLVFVPEQKITLRRERIATRFMEVETLIKENRVTPESRSMAELSIQTEKEKIDSDLAELSKENPAAAEAVKVSVESSIKERQEKIDTQISDITEIESLEKEVQAAGQEIDTGFEEDLKASGDIQDEVKEEAKPTANTLPKEEPSLDKKL